MAHPYIALARDYPAPPWVFSVLLVCKPSTLSVPNICCHLCHYFSSLATPIPKTVSQVSVICITFSSHCNTSFLQTAKLSFVNFQLTLIRSNTLELEDVQEDVSEDVDMGKINIFVKINPKSEF